MTRILFSTATLLGAAAIAWMGAGFIGVNTLAFAVTGVIGGVYIIGLVELSQFKRATASLSTALSDIPARTGDQQYWLEHWLQRLDPSLQNAARARIEGDRIGLPAPVFTPYLVGLLVMLGLLGTFVGMVDTLSGAVTALQGSTELEAVRASLAAPIQGLGVAFGTSVAGVAASAMLGLNSTLVRRERMLATRKLESKITTDFREFSLGYQRREAYRAIQSQSRALPDVADKLQAVAAQLKLTGEQLEQTVLARQTLFHEATAAQYTQLATSLDTSVRDSLAASGRAAGESMQPVVAQAMAQISQLAQDTHESLLGTARAQLQSFGEEFRSAGGALQTNLESASSAWLEQSLALQDNIRQTLAESTRELAESARVSSTGMLNEIGKLLQASEHLVQTRIESESQWLAGHERRLEALTAALSARLDTLGRQQELAQAASSERLAELGGTVALHLTQLGAGLEEPMTRLIQTASETPRAAAEVITQLRAQISNSVERDNSLLAEREQLMRELNTLTGALAQSAGGQRDAAEQLVKSSADTLQAISARFGDHMEAQASKITEAGAHVAGGAADLASLGEAFGVAVELFSSANDTMIEHLTRVETAMERAGERSDEQMAYYVAQAREIIDQSLLSQKAVMEDLRQLTTPDRQGKTRLLATEAG